MLTYGYDTDSLGFPLRVEVIIDPNLDVLGKQVSFEDENGNVVADAPHRIFLKEGLSVPMLVDVISHETYHLFYALRAHITADEETQAEVFGNFVRNVFDDLYTARLG